MGSVMNTENTQKYGVPRLKKALDLASQKKIKCRRSWAVNTL